MVLDDLTLFELNVGDADSGDAAAASDAQPSPTDASADLPVGMAVLAGLGAAAVVRRFRRIRTPDDTYLDDATSVQIE